MGPGNETCGKIDKEGGFLIPLDQLLADFFERLHLAGGQGDADFVDFL